MPRVSGTVTIQVMNVNFEDDGDTDIKELAREALIDAAIEGHGDIADVEIDSLKTEAA